MAQISSDIQIAKSLLDEGKVIGLPTETVYGLAGNALMEDAVLEIFTVKNRPKFDPLILHFSDFEKAQKFVEKPSARLMSLIQAFSPGPITFLLQKKNIITDLVTAGLPRVAVRFPSHSTAQALLQQVDYPVAAPSANPFGYVSPTSSQHVNDQLGEEITFILEGGDCEIGLESTIIGEEHDDIVIYRKGGLAIETIEKLIGKVKVRDVSSSRPSAPGMLHSHYAPRIPTQKLDPTNLVEICQDMTSGILLFKKNFDDPHTENVHYLSESGDLQEAAKNLFRMLRILDKEKYRKLFVQFVPDEGLGRAINDRLRRATSS